MRGLRRALNCIPSALCFGVAVSVVVEAAPRPLSSVAAQEGTSVEWVGTVVSDADGEPIESAQVRLLGAGGELLTVRLTDEAGRFTIVPPEPGLYRLEARRLGFEATRTDPMEWDGESETEIEIRMAHRPIELDAVEVEGFGLVLPQHRATYDGLYHRREDALPVGRERVYIRSDLESIGLDHLTVWEFVVRQRVPGMITQGIISSPQMRLPPGARRGCMPHITWAGFEGPVEIGPRDGLHYESLLDLPVQELEGIELYGASNQAPLGVRPTYSECGVIVLWPRRTAEDRSGG